MSYKEHFKEIEDEIKALRVLNKKQSQMIERRDALVNSIFEDTQESLKGTVLSNVKRKILMHLKERVRGK